MKCVTKVQHVTLSTQLFSAPPWPLVRTPEDAPEPGQPRSCERQAFISKCHANRTDDQVNSLPQA
eukprot:1583378-Amphidinium_carterae.1